MPIETTAVKCDECGHEWDSRAKVENIEGGNVECKAEGCKCTAITILDAPAETQEVDEAKLLGIKGSKIKCERFTGKDAEKEEAKHEKFAAKRLENRITKAKAKAKLSPVKRRSKLIKAKLSAHANMPSLRKYSETHLKNLIKEKKVIDDNPKAWVSLTKNGTEPFPITPVKKRTALQEIETMNLD